MSVQHHPAVVVKNVVKGYGSFLAVNDVSLQIQRGEIFGIIGPNGAGKTTLLEMILGMRIPTAGTISVHGFDPTTDRARMTAHVSIQPQSSGLFAHLTVQETLELFANFYDHPRNVDELIRLLGLEQKRKARVKTLSGGQQHRLLVGVALAGNTDVLFLDEPTGSLDPQARRGIWDVIRSNRSEGKTMVLTTHSMEEAQALCDRIAIMNRGKVLAIGSPQELIRQYLPDQLIVYETDRAPDPYMLKILPGLVNTLTTENEGKFIVRIRTSTPDETLSALLFHNQTHRARNIRTEQGTLEDVFLMLVSGGNTEKEGISA